jgi:hypothetical protein
MQYILPQISYFHFDLSIWLFKQTDFYFLGSWLGEKINKRSLNVRNDTSI